MNSAPTRGWGGSTRRSHGAAGDTRTSRDTVSGATDAWRTAMAPPMELPINVTGFPRERRYRSRMRRFASTVVERPAGGVSPNPGRSIADTAPSLPRPAAAGTQLAYDPPSPWTQTMGSPSPPRSATWTGPSMSR